MKKIVVLLFGLAAGQVLAAGTEICGGTAGGHDAAAIPVVASQFVVQSFVPKCSSNTFVAWEQNQIAFAVAAASAKGKNLFGGTTGGGAVQSYNACAGGICTSGQVTAATTGPLALAT